MTQELKKETRLERGARIALYGKIIKVRGQDAWFVFSETQAGKHYTVTEDGTCDCSDFVNRGVTCKHFWAVVAKDGVQRVRKEVKA
jgi:predicted nucleic acid-binding Zn finger protein